MKRGLVKSPRLKSDLFLILYDGLVSVLQYDALE